MILPAIYAFLYDSAKIILIDYWNDHPFVRECSCDIWSEFGWTTT